MHFLIDIGCPLEFVADMDIHAGLGAGEGPVKLLQQADSTPDRWEQSEKPAQIASTWMFLNSPTETRKTKSSKQLELD
jgi:hypothetical protein